MFPHFLNAACFCYKQVWIFYGAVIFSNFCYWQMEWTIENWKSGFKQIVTKVVSSSLIQLLYLWNHWIPLLKYQHLWHFVLFQGWLNITTNSLWTLMSLKSNGHGDSNPLGPLKWNVNRGGYVARFLDRIPNGFNRIACRGRIFSKAGNELGASSFPARNELSMLFPYTSFPTGNELKLTKNTASGLWTDYKTISKHFRFW